MPADATEILPPLLPVSPEDYGAWVITVSTILLIVTALATTVTLISRFLYASQILSVVVLACSKASVALLLISIKPFSVVLLACKMLLALIGAWTIAFTIALAVECAQTQVWDLNLGRRMNEEALYTGLAVSHILLDIGLVVLPMILMWKVQMSQWKCFQICALFGLRVL
ncbi:hypothetical protein APSETT444_006497 [Aspergillus pseudonomiae]